MIKLGRVTLVENLFNSNSTQSSTLKKPTRGIKLGQVKFVGGRVRFVGLIG